MPVFGLLNIYKPSGPTSHDMVARVRRGTREKKVGHAGTLDPMAMGVLVLCLGPATRLSEYVMQSPKTYRARVRFGIETDTYDAEGQIVAENPDPVTREAVEAALAAFRGEIEQVPPMYSAIKQRGRKLYDLARAGQDVERAARVVTISRLDLTGWTPPFADLDIECSPGTYIRSLAFDLGRAVGVGAHLAALERAASGSFTAEAAVRWPDLDAAMQAGTWQKYLLPPDRALANTPAIHLSPGDTDHVRHGRSIPAGEGDDSLARAYAADGAFLAVLERRGDAWKALKVFTTEHTEET
jgi:tRNA pseudouridine55 synthase